MADPVYRKSVTKGSVNIDLESVSKVQIVPALIDGLLHKTLLIDFFRPQRVLSTLAGFKAQVGSIGNHYLPAASQGQYDECGLLDLHASTCGVLKRPKELTCLLFTGVDVDCLSLQRQDYRETQVYALVTAGVKSNAAHMVRDSGDYHEPGTINILLLSNRRLCPRAMTQALIVATEAKTAALLDLDIRSSYTPQRNAATGTGTDGVLIVQGEGAPIEYAGGHTKIGELIARAVYAGVREALGRWEGLAADRSILERLQERHLSLEVLLRESSLSCPGLETALSELLQESRYAGFMAAALTMSDAHEAGTVVDLQAFELWCHQLAEELAGEELAQLYNLISSEGLLSLLQLALNCLANGLVVRMQKTNS